MMQQATYPVQFSVDYPDRPLNRLTTFFRLFMVIPIAIVLGAVAGGTWQWTSDGRAAAVAAGAGGLLFFAPLLMIVFRQKYPHWWFDWNLELQRFSNRVGVYLALMEDRYPSTTEHQSVHLDYAYPDAEHELNRWLPLVKWFLAIPHYVVLFFLHIALVVVVMIAWFAILFTGYYPRGMFEFVEGVIRWDNRVLAYAVVLITDQYPPFRLSPYAGDDVRRTRRCVGGQPGLRVRGRRRRTLEPSCGAVSQWPTGGRDASSVAIKLLIYPSGGSYDHELPIHWPPPGARLAVRIPGQPVGY